MFHFVYLFKTPNSYSYDRNVRTCFDNTDTKIFFNLLIRRRLSGFHAINKLNHTDSAQLLNSGI